MTLTIMRSATHKWEVMPKRTTTTSAKDAAAVALGRKGGAARAVRLTPEQRTESARKAALSRWARKTAAASAKVRSGKAKKRAKEK